MQQVARSNIRLQTFVLLAGVLLMGIKFLAWRATHSNTILSDALESIVNVVAGAFALYSLVLAAKPRDREHPYGHGKVEFLSAGFEGGLVVLAGGLIIWRAVQGFISPQQLHDLDLGMALTAAAGGLNLIMGLVLKRRGARAHSITMEASGTHLLSDAWSTAAMLLGLVAIRITGLVWLDNLFALLFAGYIIVTGLRVLRRSVAGIMDEADAGQAARVIAVLEKHRKPAWVDVHNFRMIKYGPVLHIDCHVTLPWYHSLKQAHREIAELENVVNREVGRTVELFIHMDPCIPSSCAICQLEGCPERKTAFQRRIPWTSESVLDNRKHRL
ncbi:MAG: cation transporter [Flavobacteriales bacterium]|nr:cation transporter [Flavobacteriales bacterium]